MSITRREFITRTAGGLAGATAASSLVLAQEGAPKLRLSACDWSLQANGPSGLEIAKRVGLDGLEVSAGNAADVLDIGKPELRQQYKEQVGKTGIVVSSLAMGLLNGSPMATEPRAPAWLEQTIDAAEDLDAKVVLLAFFGKGDLRRNMLIKGESELKADMLDAVVERLKDAAPRAEKAGVIIGLENTLSGKQNAAILERVKSDAVKVYYDIGNSTYNGYDVPAEIREFKDTFCQFHFKDGKYFLGEGKVEMEPVLEAITDIGYKGWLVLETAIPSKDRDADFMKNAAYVRKLFGMA